VYADPTQSVIRSRVLGQGDGEDLHETLTVTNCDRRLTKFPVEYPTACSPQAWAAGTPLLLLRVLLGLHPDGDQLTSTPHVPDNIGELTLSGIPGRWGRADATSK